MLATATCNYFALATLGDATEIGPFIFFVTQGGQGKYSHVLLSLALLPKNVANVNDPNLTSIAK
jgi:hypothetical protein